LHSTSGDDNGGTNVWEENCIKQTNNSQIDYDYEAVDGNKTATFYCNRGEITSTNKHRTCQHSAQSAETQINEKLQINIKGQSDDFWTLPYWSS